MLMTFDLTPSGKSLIVTANDLDADFKRATIPIDKVARIVEEVREEDGVNIIFVAGQKETIFKEAVSRVGTVTEFLTNEALVDALINLTGL